uniref:C2H2-type domain-containing protein n=2 Tax=Meloidogyne TaxID=189290 RepID=A0A6V7VA68_MELEN|nr:unnamed protein product [Meloidogyne enterolobii]
MSFINSTCNLNTFMLDQLLLEQLKQKELNKCQILLNELLRQFNILPLPQNIEKDLGSNEYKLQNNSEANTFLSSTPASNSSNHLNSSLKINNEQKQQRPHSCEYCQKSFRFKSNLFEHKSIHKSACHRSTFICPFCTKTCRLKGNLKKHLQIHVKNVNELERLWKNYFSRQSGRPRKNAKLIPLPKPGDDLGLVPVILKTKNNQILKNNCQWTFANENDNFKNKV